MPKQEILPTWTSLNNANFTSQSGMSDPVSSQPYNSGGLNLGDYFDVTNDEASSLSYQSNGLLFEGRYRLILLDSGASAANVKTGTVGYVRSGSTVNRVAITNAGTGGTPGVYVVNATPGSGGGSGAQITVTVGSGGTITAAVVTQAGVGYVSAPSFNVATPTSAAASTVQAALGISPNVVTSADVALGGNAALAGVGPVRPVVFLNSITPGQYGFVQELGTATVLSGSGKTGATVGQYALVDSTAKNGTMDSETTTAGIYVIGKLVDVQTSGNPFKIIMEVPVVQD